MYTEKHWNKLKQIIEHIANQQIDVFELSNMCDDLEEWNFVSKRLSNLGMLYFTDLNPSYDAITASEQIAKEDYAALGNSTGLEEEMELLHAKPICVAGLNRKIENHSTIAQDEYVKDLPVANFYLGCGFVQNEDGQPVLFVI